MNKKAWACFFLLLFTIYFKAQENRFWIQFSDKKGSPYSLSEPGDFLSAAAIQRRALFQVPYHISDLPVNPSYIQQVQDVPHTVVRYASKWLNGVVVSFDNQDEEAASLALIDALPFVEGLGKVRRLRRDSLPTDTAAKAFRTNFSNGVAAETYDYGGSESQNSQLNVQCLHEKGFRGQGITIAVLDAGFASVPGNSVFDSLRAGGRLLGTRDFVNGMPDAYYGSDHGTMVLSCMAALKHGMAVGSAPMASYWLLRTEEGPSETVSEEYNWVRGAEFADSAGADILTTSLGYTTFDDPSQNHTYQTLDGRTAPMSIAATMAARKGLFVLNAAGNSGSSAWRYVGVPADADSICSVGAVNDKGVRATFSSVGPTADGRIKPDLMARGEGAWVCSSNNACFHGNGTSFATPVLAGAVACYWQANRHLSNIRLLNRLRNNASHSRDPDNLRGWGIPNLCPPEPDDFVAHVGSENVYVRLTDADYEFFNVEVCDMLGKTLFSAETAGPLYELYLQTPGLAAGIYIVKVNTAQGTKSKKFLKLDL